MNLAVLADRTETYRIDNQGKDSQILLQDAVFHQNSQSDRFTQSTGTDHHTTQSIIQQHIQKREQKKKKHYSIFTPRQPNITLDTSTTTDLALTKYS